MFAFRTDAPAASLPAGWLQRPFPTDNPTFFFLLFRDLLFAGTAPRVVTGPERWEELVVDRGEGTIVFSAFLPPVTLGGLVRYLATRREGCL